MKFGRNLPRNQVPEWSAEYINYKGLKKLIKSATEQAKDGSEVDLASFFFSLDRNLETIDNFYNKKYSDAARRLKLLYDRYGTAPQAHIISNKEELEDLIAALLELRSQLRKLQWYGEVNRRGFIKITKKLDKKVESACAQQRYLVSRVDPRPFATNIKLSQDMNAVNVWLSRLGDIKPSHDEAGSQRSSFSLSRPISTTKMNLPAELMQALEQCLQTDDVEQLRLALGTAQDCGKEESDPFQRLLLNAFYRAISARSMKCTAELLRRIESLNEGDDINKRNCFHRLIIGMGRLRFDQVQKGQNGGTSPASEAGIIIVPAEAPELEFNFYGLKETESSRLPTGGDDAAELITFLLKQLTENQRTVLQCRDSFGRLPLHYAAKYGFVVVSRVIMDRMLTWGLLDLSEGINSISWQDNDGNSPLHLSVIGGWRLTTEILLNACAGLAATIGANGAPLGWNNANNLLTLATKANFFNIVKLLVQAGADGKFQDATGETALHVAARFGHVECANALLSSSEIYQANLNIPEVTFGWTPLLVAAVDGQFPMVQLLIDAGADVDMLDSSGWSAKEHAALRGHMVIAELLARHTRTIKPASPIISANLPKAPSLGDRGSTNKENTRMPAPAIKTFGHRYLTDESMVLVSIGSMDQRKNVKPVDLENIPYAEAHATRLDTALSLIVSASGAHGEPVIIDLPVQENISTEPIRFMTKDITKVKLLFDIIPTYSGSKEQIVGRGVALLQSIKPTLGSRKMNLKGDICVPIVAAMTLDFLGSVNFNFLVVTPFSHPNMSITETQTYWKSLTAPMVIGHRGLGKNSVSRKSLQLGENTIQSFIAAANLGASYVEFDVQLTKDHVPVIYHDFLVSETGIDAPVHTLTLEQFLHVNDAQTPRSSRASSPNPRASGNSYTHLKTNGTTPHNPTSTTSSRQSYRSRANSLGAPNEAHGKHDPSMSERMKHTRDFKNQGYKGNSRGTFIHAPFTTLEEMLRRLPQHIGFNIEMKYPMLFESEEHEMDTYAVELNSFVDTILNMVYDLAQGRHIIFSSFHPDICLLISLKQPSIPILFLTDAGTSDVGDIRASSLQEAIRFATRWNLLGVVSAAEPFVLCPRLVRVVKESGLVCVSYGGLNNESENVRVQVDEGIDAVIVDSVLAIRKGLTAGGMGKEAKEMAVSARKEMAL